VGEAEANPLFFTLIPVLAPLSFYDQENCLINVGTEAKMLDHESKAGLLGAIDSNSKTIH